MSEVNGIKCDACGKFQSLSHSFFAFIDEAPASWYTAHDSGRHGKVLYFCSKEHMGAWATGVMPEPLPAPKPWHVRFFRWLTGREK